jgi:putative hydrolase of the HAD superfamily
VNEPKAIGFDLFNTLLTVHPLAMEEAMRRLISVLHAGEVPVDAEAFGQAYVEAAKRFLREAQTNGRETHNRFWIAAALETQGYHLSPEDNRITKAVEAYFSAFYPYCQLIPGTKKILGQLAGRYPLGLLSNFTHPAAARKIIDLLGLRPFFQTVLISGELGYRKPHPSTFERLVHDLSVQADQVLFVGDDPEVDVQGARDAGLQPVMTTCVLDGDLPSARTPLSPSRTDPPEDVPTISCWQDLLTLLEV